MAVTPLYAAFFALLLVALQWKLVALRDHYRTARLQEDGHADMALLGRAIAHLVEYTPLALLLMLIAETQGTSPFILHALGMALFAGRALHLKGLHDPSGKNTLRRLGTRLVWAQIVVASLLCAASSFDIVF